MTPKHREVQNSIVVTQGIRPTVDQRDLMKLEHICKGTEVVSPVNREGTEWEQTFAS